MLRSVKRVSKQEGSSRLISHFLLGLSAAQSASPFETASGLLGVRPWRALMLRSVKRVSKQEGSSRLISHFLLGLSAAQSASPFETASGLLRVRP